MRVGSRFVQRDVDVEAEALRGLEELGDLDGLLRGLSLGRVRARYGRLSICPLAR